MVPFRSRPEDYDSQSALLLKRGSDKQTLQQGRVFYTSRHPSPDSLQGQFGSSNMEGMSLPRGAALPGILHCPEWLILASTDSPATVSLGSADYNYRNLGL